MGLNKSISGCQVFKSSNTGFGSAIVNIAYVNQHLALANTAKIKKKYLEVSITRNTKG